MEGFPTSISLYLLEYFATLSGGEGEKKTAEMLGYI